MGIVHIDMGFDTCEFKSNKLVEALEYIAANHYNEE